MNEPTFPEKQVLCKLCQSQMVIKVSKFGKFLSCINYPQCKATRPMSLGVDCPQPDCDGEIVERKTKKDKTFYGCIKYPTCEFTIHDKPIPISCPECDNYFMLEKMALWKSLICPEKDCGHTSRTFSNERKSKGKGEEVKP